MRILHTRVDEMNMQQVLAAIESFIAAFPNANSQPQHIVTINPEGIMLTQEDELFYQAVEAASIVTADGSGVLWAAEKMGQPLTERVTGIDLTMQLMQLAAEKSWRVYMLGAKPGIAEQAAANLRQQNAGLNIVGVDNGYFQDRQEQVIESIAAAKPDILLAALGMPFQEKWLYQHQEKLHCKVMIGIGGSFDVIAGNVRRAPQMWQKLRLEWLWRLLSEPARWRRYLAIPRFMRAVKREIRQQRS